MYIEYSVKNVFGTDRLYPENSWAEFLCEVSDAKTLAPWIIARLLNEGVDCQEVLPTKIGFLGV